MCTERYRYNNMLQCSVNSHREEMRCIYRPVDFHVTPRPSRTKLAITEDMMIRDDSELIKYHCSRL